MSKDVKPKIMSDFVIKLIACVFIMLCLAVGVVGLILPIIPGIVFLAVGAMIAARYFPSLDKYLRKNDTIRAYLDSGEGFIGLSFWGKIQYSIWFFLKIFIDSLVFIIHLMTKIMGLVINKYHYNK